MQQGSEVGNDVRAERIDGVGPADYVRARNGRCAVVAGADLIVAVGVVDDPVPADNHAGETRLVGRNEGRVEIGSLERRFDLADVVEVRAPELGFERASESGRRSCHRDEEVDPRARSSTFDALLRESPRGFLDYSSLATATRARCVEHPRAWHAGKRRPRARDRPSPPACAPVLCRQDPGRRRRSLEHGRGSLRAGDESPPA